MANLDKTMRSARRIEHVGEVVTPPGLLAQRHAERAERLRRAKVAGSMIIGDAPNAIRVTEPA